MNPPAISPLFQLMDLYILQLQNEPPNHAMLRELVNDMSVWVGFPTAEGIPIVLNHRGHAWLFMNALTVNGEVGLIQAQLVDTEAENGLQQKS